ncbi:V-set and transmembrane domain-containing protein 2-like protein [Scyliorhinus canicula]|uniref:V-set and transmembrane domain-containing protein 2-like protein n=1 Tax=Scyliorhinus canicula TaxID=7830 RepID=UPI0018F5CCC9|nr:V-set and transmembrane domain-containing protein 2-like protein [Scyliorhinus canicula]
MGMFGVTVGALHYLGLYVQLCASSQALFTEVPRDVTARAGQDVEMACAFRGSGSPSYSLEIQWWYIRNSKDWTDKQAWSSHQMKASTHDESRKDATKISAVKVVGSNISHKLRLSTIKTSDEGTYECRVTDYSEGKPRHHKAKAYLRVKPEQGHEVLLHGAAAHMQETKVPPSSDMETHTNHIAKSSSFSNSPQTVQIMNEQVLDTGCEQNDLSLDADRIHCV